jgi:hypothetical protein
MPQHPKIDDEGRELQRRLGAELRAIALAILNTESPFEPPPDRPPPGAPGQRIPHDYWSEDEAWRRTGS